MPEGGGIGSEDEAVEAGATPAFGIVSVMPERPTPATANCASTLKFHGPEVAGPETPGAAVLVSMDNGNMTSMPSGKIVTVAVPTEAKRLQPPVALKIVA